jgi:hypothetical protein
VTIFRIIYLLLTTSGPLIRNQWHCNTASRNAINLNQNFATTVPISKRNWRINQPGSFDLPQEHSPRPPCSHGMWASPTISPVACPAAAGLVRRRRRRRWDFFFFGVRCWLGLICLGHTGFMSSRLGREHTAQEKVHHWFLHQRSSFILVP